VPTALGPVVRPGVHDGEVRSAGVGEQRLEALAGEGVGRVGERVLVGNRVVPVHQAAAEDDLALGVGDVHPVGLGPRDQVDDMGQRRVEQDREGAVPKVRTVPV
jgi:hypothetical protein